MRRQELEKIEREISAKGISRTNKALVLFLLCDYPPAKHICDTLAKDLRGKNWKWIEPSQLHEVVLTILALYSYAPSSVDGICMANLAKRMLGAEVDVGGPYYDKAHQIDVFTNAAIALIFSIFESPLPKVQSFLGPYVHAPTKQEYLLLVFTEWAMHEDSAVVVPYVKRLLNMKTNLEPAPSRSNTIADQARVDIEEFDNALRPAAFLMLESVAKTDTKQEITSLSRMFADSLVLRPAFITDDICNLLGRANLFTWMAYTVYDDFIDNEGNPEYLPVANVTIRKALNLYRSVAMSNSELEDMIYHCFDDMDAANAWELTNCRYTVTQGHITVKNLPRYGNRIVLAKRAGAHVLGAIVITFLIQDITRKQRLLIQKGFSHFLIARQLNDDLHDWREDFERGHISFVVGFLLRRINVSAGDYGVSELSDRMQEYFWKSGIEELSNLVIDHIEHAKRSFSKSNLLLLDGPLFEDILDYIEGVARNSIATHEDQKNFLSEYAN